MKIYIMDKEEKRRKNQFRIEMLAREVENLESYCLQEFRKRVSHWRNRTLLQFMDDLNQPLN